MGECGALLEKRKQTSNEEIEPIFWVLGFVVFILYIFLIVLTVGTFGATNFISSKK